MMDDSINISMRSWTRAVENINKVGYSDGVIDGQNASFQNSFDMGYMQGLKFGLKLGYNKAIDHEVNTKIEEEQPSDPSCINCQICLHETTKLQNVVNLYNTQKEQNDNYFKE